MPKPLELSGMRFGKLTVIKRDGSKNGRSKWVCKCDCGNIKTIIGKNLKSGKTQSCGCIHKRQLSERSTTHGLSKSRIYRIWHDMVNRCEYKNDKSYCYYGARGIRVCKEWRENPDVFIKWAFENGYDETLTIDRINNDGMYEPSNCRWVTMAVQNKNKRKRGTALCQ